MNLKQIEKIISLQKESIDLVIELKKKGVKLCQKKP